MCPVILLFIVVVVMVDILFLLQQSVNSLNSKMNVSLLIELELRLFIFNSKVSLSLFLLIDEYRINKQRYFKQENNTTKYN